MTTFSASILPSAPALEAYSDAAQKTQAIYINVANTQYQVLGVGETPKGRSVGWIAPDTDTTFMFTQALSQTFGGGIANAVSNQLGLSSAPGKPLSSRTVLSAINMADNAKNAMLGVDFLSRLSSSSTSNTPAFRQACKDCNIDPASIDMTMRQHIDATMQAKFDTAFLNGTSPVPLEQAGEWLRDIIKTSMTP